MTTEKNDVVKAIGTICRTAKTMMIVNGEYVDGTVPKLEETAAALAKHFDLGDEVMDKYREEIEASKELESTHGTAVIDVEDAQDIIFEMCNSLTDPKEIMSHMFNARELMYLSNKELEQRESLW